MNNRSPFFSLKWLLSTLLVVGGIYFCIRMGLWQLDRLAQRRSFNAHYIQIVAQPELLLEKLPSEDMTLMEYRTVSAHGKFDFEQNVVRRNQYHDGQPGFSLITPLVMSDGEAILVERGWIPAEGNEKPDDWRKYDVEGVQTVKGILRLGQSASEFGGLADPDVSEGQTRLNYWNQINLDLMAKQLPYKIAPVFIQPSVIPENLTPPFPTNTIVEVTEGPHLGYALQWFTFSTLLLFGYPYFLYKQLHTLYSKLDAENRT
jgi:surfeit locus 1 family protein